MREAGSFLKKIGYAIGANFLSLVVAILTTLLIPKFLEEDVAQYGYLQIYLFYVSYIGFFHFGWCDGIYLRDGGKRYSELNKEVYSGQFWLFLGLQICIAIVISLLGCFGAQNNDYRFIWIALGINIVLMLPCTLLSYYLQTTNRIKGYAAITTVGRTTYGVSIVLIFLFFQRDYKCFVFGDILSKLVALIVSIYCCRDIVVSKSAKLKDVCYEVKLNINAGIKLLIANIASMLITGIVRWGIQTKWDVATYGKVSFSLSVSNLLLTFISAVSLVLYPTLKRSDEATLKKVYNLLRDILMIPLLGCLVVYYPIECILSIWLPQYIESMRYLAILFPMCIYAAKMTMIIQTYMNVFRMEKKMLKVNLVGVVVALITTGISVFLMENLVLAMISIVINQMFRCIYAEFVLAKCTDIKVAKGMISESVLTAVFIYANWFICGWLGTMIYMMAYFIYLIAIRKRVMCLVKEGTKLLKKGKMSFREN